MLRLGARAGRPCHCGQDARATAPARACFARRLAYRSARDDAMDQEELHLQLLRWAPVFRVRLDRERTPPI